MTAEPVATPNPIAYRRADAAEAVGISVPELDRAIAAGEIDVRKVGRRVIVPRVSLLRWLRIDETEAVS